MSEPAAAQAHCDHNYETRLLGGHPITVRACTLCRTPDWNDLAEQANALYRWGREEALAGKPPRDHLSAYDMPREQPDASLTIAAAPTADDYEQQRQRADRAEAELRRYTEAESADAAAGSYAGRAEQAEAALARVHTLAARLEEFAENALKEPDRKLYAALARDLRSHAAINPPAHNTGPSVAECAAADRLWWDSDKTGE